MIQKIMADVHIQRTIVCCKRCKGVPLIPVIENSTKVSVHHAGLTGIQVQWCGIKLRNECPVITGYGRKNITSSSEVRRMAFKSVTKINKMVTKGQPER